MRTKIKVISELRAANAKNLEARNAVAALRSAGDNSEKMAAAMQVAFDAATSVENLRSELVDIEDQEITDALIAKGANESAQADEGGKRKTAEYRAAFNNYLRSSGGFANLSEKDRKALLEMRALNTGTNTDGGYVVDTETMTKVQEESITWGALYALTQKMRTQRGNVIQWPVANEGMQRGVIVGEAENHGKADTGFTTENMGAHKISSRIILVSDELLQDAYIDIAAYVTAIARKRVDLGIDYYLVHGAGGDAQPKGILLQLRQSKKVATSGTSAANIMDSIIDVIHAVDPVYRNMPGFAVSVNDNTLKTLRKWKDSQGNPIYLNDPRADWSDTLFGKKLVIDNELPDIGTDGWVLAGDWNAVVVRLAGDMIVRRLDELYAETGQVGFLAWQRFGIVLTDKAAMAGGFTAANAGTPDRFGTTEVADVGGEVFNPVVSNAPNDSATSQRAAAGGAGASSAPADDGFGA